MSNGGCMYVAIGKFGNKANEVLIIEDESVREKRKGGVN